MSSSSRGHGIASQDPSWQSLKNKDTIVHRPWKFWPPARLPEGPPGCQRSTASGEGLESADAGCAAAGPSPKRRPQSSRGRISGDGDWVPGAERREGPRGAEAVGLGHTRSSPFHLERARTVGRVSRQDPELTLRPSFVGTRSRREVGAVATGWRRWQVH